MLYHTGTDIFMVTYDNLFNNTPKCKLTLENELFYGMDWDDKA